MSYYKWFFVTNMTSKFRRSSTLRKSLEFRIQESVPTLMICGLAADGRCLYTFLHS